MTVAIIGVGQIGSNLALDLTDDRSSLDEQLLIAARSIESAQRLVDTLPSGRARAVTTEEAITTADTIVLAVWLDVAKDLIATHADSLAGKTIVDPSNPIAPDDKGGFVKTIDENQSSGQILASLLTPKATLVKAFGTLAAPQLREAAFQEPERNVGFYAADDDAAGARIAGLIAAAGFEPLQVGGIDQSIRIEVFGDLHQFGALGAPVTLEAARAALHGPTQ